MKKVSYAALFLLLLSLLSTEKGVAEDGKLDMKTDSITQKKQRSQGNEIEHQYAPNLFLDKMEEQSDLSQESQATMLEAANGANFSRNSLQADDGMDTRGYQSQLFQNYAVSEKITIDTELPEALSWWKIVGILLFLLGMTAAGFYLGRSSHGNKLFKYKY